MISTVERARGRWREILPLLGVDIRFLVNRHGPCPLCGGKDRFRFDDRDSAGTYFCSQCGAGNGITLLRKLHQWEFKTACDEIDRILGHLRPCAASKAPTSRSDDAGRTERNIRRALERAREPEVVARYLKRRGLSVISPVLLGDSARAYYDEEGGRLLGYFPAVLAPIVSIAGELCSAAVIYDSNEVPRPKKFMPKIRTINGAAVRLFEPTDPLAVTEGIENALAVHQMFDQPAWAALNANGLATFEPPPGLRRLVVYGDNDENYTGQKAAYSLAFRLQKTCKVEVRLPPEPGVDWLDLFNRGNEK